MTETRRPALGEVWTTRPNVWVPSLRQWLQVGSQDFVLIVGEADGSLHSDEPDVRVLPLSTVTEYLTSDDVLIAPEESGLTVPLVAQTWNTRPALVRNLAKRIGALAKSALERVVDVHDARYGDTDSVHAAGLPIEDADDPRRVYQRAEAKRFAYLSDAVLSLLDSRGHVPSADAHCYVPDAEAVEELYRFMKVAIAETGGENLSRTGEWRALQPVSYKHFRSGYGWIAGSISLSIAESASRYLSVLMPAARSYPGVRGALPAGRRPTPTYDFSEDLQLA